MEEIEELKKLVNTLLDSNKSLEKRVSKLEKMLEEKPDYRCKDSIRRVLGFALSDVNGYFNAVKTVDGEQIRVYIGKNTSEENVRKKIVECFVTNFRFYKTKLKYCDELREVPEIAKLLEVN